MMQGRVDIHTHLLPAVDDGCEDSEQSLACVRSMIQAGYVAAVCTPHIWPNLPNNIPPIIRSRAAELQQQIDDAGLQFKLFTGGELQLRADVTEWMAEFGVPTLGDSRAVLFDFWQPTWPDWVEQSIDWLSERDYQPIMAHPERMPCVISEPNVVYDLVGKGLWLQGNLRSLTGENGPHADEAIRQFLGDRLYRFMAMDVHGPDFMPSHIDGLEILKKEFGESAATYLTQTSPRALLGFEN